jgi:tripartite-type tricarboxylate transporter receptor subunit TctC
MVAGSAFAQSYPARPVRIIVPTAPGGSIDTTARVVANKLGELWGQSIVVENRAGASMIIGAEAVAKSPADGYTLLVAHDGTMAMNPVAFPNLPYSPAKDFVPISLMVQAPLVLMVHPSTGVNTVRELIAHAQANPGKLNHGNGGTATLLALELFNAIAKTAIVPVPYKGGAPAVASIIAGETQVVFADAATSSAALRSGKIKLLAVTTSERSKMFPGVPTVSEAGATGYETYTWIAAFAPAGTPADVTAKLGADIRRALAAPDARERLEGINLEVVASDGDLLARAMKADTEKWGRLVRERNIKVGP